MLSRRAGQKALGRFAVAMLASAGMILTGCMTEPNEPVTYNGSNRSSSRAIQASDTSRVPATGDSRVAMAFPTGVRSTSDLYVEQIGPREARVGRPYTYQLRVTNLTDQPLTGVVLRQRLPENFKLTGDSATQTSGGGNDQTQINVGELAAHQSRTIELTVTASGSGTLDTCLSAQFNPPTLCARVPIVSPALKATVAGPSQADVCQDL